MPLMNMKMIDTQGFSLDGRSCMTETTQVIRESGIPSIIFCEDSGQYVETKTGEVISHEEFYEIKENYHSTYEQQDSTPPVASNVDIDDIIDQVLELKLRGFQVPPLNVELQVGDTKAGNFSGDSAEEVIQTGRIELTVWDPEFLRDAEYIVIRPSEPIIVRGFERRNWVWKSAYQPSFLSIEGKELWYSLTDPKISDGRFTPTMGEIEQKSFNFNEHNVGLLLPEENILMANCLDAVALILIGMRNVLKDNEHLLGIEHYTSIADQLADTIHAVKTGGPGYTVALSQLARNEQLIQNLKTEFNRRCQSFNDVLRKKETEIKELRSKVHSLKRKQYSRGHKTSNPNKRTTK